MNEPAITAAIPTRRTRAPSQGPLTQTFTRPTAPAIASLSHFPDEPVASFTAFRVSAWDCWSKFTILRYQKTRRLLSRADQLRSIRPAMAASPLSFDSAAAGPASGSSLSHAPFLASQISAQACASEFRMV